MFEHHLRMYLKASYVACHRLWNPSSRYEYDRVPEKGEVHAAKRVFIEVFKTIYAKWEKRKDAHDRSAGSELGFAQYQFDVSLAHLEPRHTRIDEAKRLAEPLAKYFGLMEACVFNCPLGERFDTSAGTYKKEIERFLGKHAQFTNVMIGSVDFAPIIKVLQVRLLEGIQHNTGPVQEQITRMGQKEHQEFINELIYEFKYTESHFRSHGRGGAEHLYLMQRPGYGR
ncbi:MAG: hypothetical protein Q7S65_00900 [Nanoarchaeota archaeon]|nr:hypothetical protein [Nanoarchaeota archaeon]